MAIIHRIVFSGGPGAGKTAVSSALAAAQPQRFVAVPEAATQVYSQRGTRWDQLDAGQRRDVQRNIFGLQLQQEADIAQQHPGKILLLDRGSLDGSAYWPDGAESYWAEMGTTAAEQLARYDAVIWLQTCAVLGVYDAQASNPCRHEDAAGAIAAGEKVLAMRRGHSRLYRVEAYPNLEQKIAAAREIISTILAQVGWPATVAGAAAVSAAK